MKNQIKNYGNIIALFLMFSSLISYAQVGIGTSPPNKNSSLELQGGNTIDKGFVLPLATTNTPFNKKPIKEGTLLYSYSDSMIYYVVDSSLTSPKYNALSPWFYNPNLNSTDVTTDKNVFIGGTLNVNVGAVFNEASTNADFRVESDGNDHMLFVDGSNNKVGVGKNSPAHKLDVVGNINSSGKIKEVGYDLIPKGVIVMWQGASAPSGWALCKGQTINNLDGTTGTAPDLRERFIVGAGTAYAIGAKGGENTVTLSSAQCATKPHKHGMDHGHGVTESDHTHGYTIKDWAGTGNRPGTSGAGGPSWTGTTNGAKSNLTVNAFTGFTDTSDVINMTTSAHENRPPYFALAFIIKL
jgi:microcystin-dependent protein